MTEVLAHTVVIPLPSPGHLAPPQVSRLLCARARIADSARLCGSRDPDRDARRLLGAACRLDPRGVADVACLAYDSVRVDGWANDPAAAGWMAASRSVEALRWLAEGAPL